MIGVLHERTLIELALYFLVCIQLTNVNARSAFATLTIVCAASSSVSRRSRCDDDRNIARASRSLIKEVHQLYIHICALQFIP